MSFSTAVRGKPRQNRVAAWRATAYWIETNPAGWFLAPPPKTAGADHVRWVPKGFSGGTAAAQFPASRRIEAHSNRRTGRVRELDRPASKGEWPDPGRRLTLSNGHFLDTFPCRGSARTVFAPLGGALLKDGQTLRRGVCDIEKAAMAMLDFLGRGPARAVRESWKRRVRAHLRGRGGEHGIASATG